MVLFARTFVFHLKDCNPFPGELLIEPLFCFSSQSTLIFYRMSVRASFYTCGYSAESVKDGPMKAAPTMNTAFIHAIFASVWSVSNEQTVIFQGLIPVILYYS